jgi:hypothetical protein
VAYQGSCLVIRESDFERKQRFIENFGDYIDFQTSHTQRPNTGINLAGNDASTLGWDKNLGGYLDLAGNRT